MEPITLSLVIASLAAVGGSLAPLIEKWVELSRRSHSRGQPIALRIQLKDGEVFEIIAPPNLEPREAERIAHKLSTLLTRLPSGTEVEISTEPSTKARQVDVRDVIDPPSDMKEQ